MKTVSRGALLGLMGIALLPQGIRATDETHGEVPLSAISGSVEHPRGHLRMRNPAPLEGDQAARIYHIVRDALAHGYGAANIAAAQDYQAWTRFNTEPYLSATHGNHWVNIYANETARQYGRYEQAGRFPVGSIVAKDSFSVTGTHEILLGSLVLMIKMPAGFNYVSGDWKYVQIQPDGTLFGETNGIGAARVEYCIGCHLARENQDHLFFVPPEYRPAPQP